MAPPGPGPLRLACPFLAGAANMQRSHSYHGRWADCQRFDKEKSLGGGPIRGNACDASSLSRANHQAPPSHLDSNHSLGKGSSGEVCLCRWPASRSAKSKMTPTAVDVGVLGKL